jgi:hypothetical protein
MRRIICAAMAKKCARFCQRTFALIDETQICFVNESGGLQSVTRALAVHAAMSQPVQLVFNEREQAVQSFAVGRRSRRRAIGSSRAVKARRRSSGTVSTSGEGLKNGGDCSTFLISQFSQSRTLLAADERG